MSRTLEQRLASSRVQLGRIDAALNSPGEKLAVELEQHFRSVSISVAEVDHWIGLIHARAAARALLDGLESLADANDQVPWGAARAKFEHVRLAGMQAYLATNWALADQLTGMAGRVFCTQSAAFEEGKGPQLVSHFIRDDRKAKTARAVHQSVRPVFGWPIAISYSLRNHFVHEGARAFGVEFFAGPTARSGFAATDAGWQKIERSARGYGVDSNHVRAGATWPSEPKADVRTTLAVAETEIDDALGMLVGSACALMTSHLQFMLGADT